jgi:hypothetical protein
VLRIVQRIHASDFNASLHMDMAALYSDRSMIGTETTFISILWMLWFDPAEAE